MLVPVKVAAVAKQRSWGWRQRPSPDGRQIHHRIDMVESPPLSSNDE